MDDVVIEGKILRWGNSYGIRVKKDELEAGELHPGEEVVVRIERRGGRLDLAGLPTFASGRTDTSARHDDLLGRSRSQEHVRGSQGPEDEGDRA